MSPLSSPGRRRLLPHQNSRLSRGIALVALAGFALVAAGCVDGGGDNATDGSSTTGSSTTGSSVADDTSTTNTSVGGDTSTGDPDDDQAAVLDPEICGIDRVNVQPFYMVTNIPEDDPDGGLNLRSNYEGGTRLTTLPEKTVVLVLDCVIADDGGTWYAVEIAAGDGGWVNAGFLTADIDPLLPTSGGQDTERKVVAVLDALAARKWDVAAAELSAGGVGVLTLNDLLERGSTSDDDLPELLEGYCQIRLCDAPYEVVEIRGSYLPDRIQPEVDVRFDYPGGSTVETFRLIQTPDGDTLGSLPGQSNLAWTTSRPTTEALAGAAADDAPDGLLDAAEAIRQALLSEDGPERLAAFVPEEGTAFSASSYIDPNPAGRVTVSAAELLADPADVGDQLRIWGYQDGIGTAIVDSVPGWIGGYRRSTALLEPDVVGVDQRIGRSNTIENLAEQFPDATVVEYHRTGRGELADFNWSSVRLAMEQRPQGWVVVAITSDTWTI